MQFFDIGCLVLIFLIFLGSNIGKIKYNISVYQFYSLNALNIF